MQKIFQKIKMEWRTLKSRFASPIVCSSCFSDSGLVFEAKKIGKKNLNRCPHCGDRDGVKLTKERLSSLQLEFFWNGSYTRTYFGGFSQIVSNPLRYGEREVKFPPWLEKDAHLIEDKLRIGLFLYGPPLWRVGYIEPLERLQRSKTRVAEIESILSKFPERTLLDGHEFYRVRKNLTKENENNLTQYDAPSKLIIKNHGRLDSKGLPCLYGSENLEICLHECRVSIPDVCFVASIRTLCSLRMLDLTAEPTEPFQTEFKSLNLAMRFLFTAESQSYEITRAIARFARKKGFDGIYYPSYFSLVKPERIPNIALFGFPIRDRKVEVTCINKAMLKSSSYEVTMGPIFNLE
jgi:DNA-directed RNA polymerase subunit RPC12/RpoP